MYVLGTRPVWVQKSILDDNHEAVALLLGTIFSLQLPFSTDLNIAVYIFIAYLVYWWCYIYGVRRKSVKTVIEIFVTQFLKAALGFLPSCVSEIKVCHLTTDSSNWFVSLPLHLAMKWWNLSLTVSHVTLQWTGNGELHDLNTHKLGEFHDLNTHKINIRAQWTVLMKQYILHWGAGITCW